MDDNRGQVGAALDALSAAVSTMRGVGPWQASDAGVAELIVAVEVATRALAGVQLAAIAEGITRGLPFTAGAGTGVSAPGRWVRSLIPLNPGDAGRRAALAVDLFTDSGRGSGASELTPTRDAVLAGAISTAHAQVVVAAVGQLLPPHTPAGLVDDATRAEAQALLLGAATGGTGPVGTPHAPLDPTQVAKAATALTATLDPGHGDRLAHDEDTQHQLRTFTVTPLPSGMCHAAGLLTKTAGHALIGVLQALSAPQPAVDGTPDPRTAGMRTHDGLETAARHLQAAGLGTGGLLPGAHGSPNRLVVSVDIHTLAAHLGLNQTHPSTDPPLRVPELPGRWPLSPLAAHVIACDADLVAVLTGPDGSPLDVTDTSYPFTTRQRAAVINRDKHCTYGTCTAPPPWCHVHHLQPFSRGGPTTVTNAALLCGVHHRHVHNHHLTGTRTTSTGSSGTGSSGTVIWQAPTGTHPNPHLPPVAVQAAITALATRWHQRQQRQRQQRRGLTREPSDQDAG